MMSPSPLPAVIVSPVPERAVNRIVVARAHGERVAGVGAGHCRAAHVVVDERDRAVCGGIDHAVCVG